MLPEKSERSVISAFPLRCEGAGPETPPLASKPAYISVTIYDNATREVGCSYLHPNGICAASVDAKQCIQLYPISNQMPLEAIGSPIPEEIPSACTSAPESAVNVLASKVNLDYDIDGSVRRSILEFLQSAQAQVILTYMSRPMNDDRTENEIAGAIFEGIGYRWMSRQLKEGSVLLSPGEVLTFFKELYPYKKVERPEGLSESIMGVSVPDGLVMQADPSHLRITSVVEYKNLGPKTLDRVHTRIRDQAIRFKSSMFSTELKERDTARKLGQVVNSLRPDLPARPVVLNNNVDLIYVVPQNSQLQIPGAKDIRVPITSFELNHLKRALQTTVRDQQIG